VTARIVRVLAPNPSVYTLEGTNTWILGSDPTVVIDPGPDIAPHLEEVARVAGRVGAILLTHRHEDHATGATALAEVTGAPVLCFADEGATHLRDEQALTFGDLSLVAFHVPGHGPAVFRVREKLDEYLHHRVERERQVLSALGDDARTAEELVPAIYAEYPKEAWPLAARSVLAHLLKLETEGRVRRAEPAPEDDARFALTETHPCARCGRPVRGAAPLCEKHSLEMLQEPVTAPTSTEPHRGGRDGADAARPTSDSASG
jgi:hypothetical protein